MSSGCGRAGGWSCGGAAFEHPIEILFEHFVEHVQARTAIIFGNSDQIAKATERRVAAQTVGESRCNIPEGFGKILARTFALLCGKDFSYAKEFNVGAYQH